MAVEQHYTVTEAARLVGVSPFTVRRWLKTGRLCGHKTGDDPQRARWRVPESELRRILGGDDA